LNRIAIINYGAGNIRSVSKALEKSGAQVRVTEDPKIIEQVDKIVLPGVGAFGKAVEAIQSRHLVEPLILAVEKNKPFLGICLGMHMLFQSSEENPETRGFSILKGSVVRFPTEDKVPHLGWNQVHQKNDSPLWKDIPDQSFYYFAHSYFVQPENSEVIAGETEYGISFTSSIWKENLFGVQFHPEKSQKWGLKILENFVQL
jgi:glutamine amidotransferase